MLHEKSIQINARFFAALNALLQLERIETKLQFCELYGLDQANLLRLSKEPTRKFELALLYFICNDFGVSPEWLITGKGTMFQISKKP